MRLLNTQEALRQSSVLDQLPAESADWLRERIQLREYRRREVIYQEGDLISGPAWNHWGLIRAYQSCEDGRELTLLISWPGELSTPSLSGLADWPASTTALTPVVRAVIPQSVFEEATRRDARVTRAFLNMLAVHARERYAWSAYLMSVPLRQRLRRILRRMAHELGTPGEDGVLLNFPVVQEDLAIIARVTRDEIGRVVREMLNEGIVQRRPGRRLLIPDARVLDD
jgi:CRP-like cAMP-binding protein